jgi:putative Holliday junction resolvase
MGESNSLRVMALDPGRRRVGVAVSDEQGRLATPVVVVERRGGKQDIERLRALVQQYQPAELLVGLPVLPSGDLGEQAEQSRRFADTLGREFGLPVRLWNESYSTVEALRLRADRPGRRRRSRSVDAEAAAVFLQDFLDSRQ